MQNAWQFFGGGMQLMNDFFQKYGIYAIPCGNTGCQMGGWFRREIRDPADFNGLKFRIGGYAGRVLEKLGCVPYQIAGGDLFAALEKGTIDAAEWVGPYDDEKLGLQKVAPYYYYPGWWEGGAMIHNFVNLDKWNGLTPGYQSVVRTCSEMANTWMQSKYDAANPAALKRLLAGGAKLQPFPPVVMDACLKAAFGVYREVAATNADFRKVFEAMMAFRNDQYLWWQVAEYTYDSYLIRNRTRA
jgi:TRAP-type mannitol/chloroaromatic compound transport system substrate-binding protein